LATTNGDKLRGRERERERERESEGEGELLCWVLVLRCDISEAMSFIYVMQKI